MEPKIGPDKAKMEFLAWWPTVPADKQVALVYDFLQASKSTSAKPDAPEWAKVSVSALAEARKQSPEEWVEVIELALRPNESIGDGKVVARLVDFGKAWLEKSQAAITSPMWVLAAIAGAGLLWWMTRKKG